LTQGDLRVILSYQVGPGAFPGPREGSPEREEGMGKKKGPRARRPTLTVDLGPHAMAKLDALVAWFQARKAQIPWYKWRVVTRSMVLRLAVICLATDVQGGEFDALNLAREREHPE
jgi:hypothetical protein